MLIHLQDFVSFLMIVLLAILLIHLQNYVFKTVLQLNKLMLTILLINVIPIVLMVHLLIIPLILVLQDVHQIHLIMVPVHQIISVLQVAQIILTLTITPDNVFHQINVIMLHMVIPHLKNVSYSVHLIITLILIQLFWCVFKNVLMAPMLMMTLSIAFQNAQTIKLMVKTLTINVYRFVLITYLHKIYLDYVYQIVQTVALLTLMFECV